MTNMSIAWMVGGVAACCRMLRDVAYTVGNSEGHEVRGRDMAYPLLSNHQEGRDELESDAGDGDQRQVCAGLFPVPAPEPEDHIVKRP